MGQGERNLPTAAVSWADIKDPGQCLPVCARLMAHNGQCHPVYLPIHVGQVGGPVQGMRAGAGK